MSDAGETMRVWILRAREDLKADDNPWEPWYDKTFGVVVRAGSEGDARRLANESGGAEVGPIRTDEYRTGGDPWLDPAYSTCEELTGNGEAGVLLRDLHSTG